MIDATGSYVKEQKKKSPGFFEKSYNALKEDDFEKLGNLVWDKIKSTANNIYNQITDTNPRKVTFTQKEKWKFPQGEYDIPIPHNDGQNRWKTLSEKSLLPKPASLYYVYFTINPEIKFLLSRLESKLNKDYSSAFTGIERIDDNINNDVIVARNKEDLLSKVEELKKYIKHISRFVKQCDRPGTNIEWETVNSYNHRMTIPVRTTFDDLRIIFYDDNDSIVYKVFNTLLQLLNNNFFGKSLEHFMTDNRLSGIDEVLNGAWGFDTFSNNHLFSQITQIEFFKDKFSVTNFNKPKLVKFNPSMNSLGDWNAKTIDTVFNFEGITHNLVNIEEFKDYRREALYGVLGQDVYEEVADIVRVRYAFDKGVVQSDKKEQSSYQLLKKRLKDIKTTAERFQRMYNNAKILKHQLKHQFNSYKQGIKVGKNLIKSIKNPKAIATRKHGVGFHNIITTTKNLPNYFNTTLDSNIERTNRVVRDLPKIDRRMFGL